MSPSPEKSIDFDPLAAPCDAGARRADARKILLRLVEMGFELGRAFGQHFHVVDELADLGLDRLRFVAHARVAQNRLGDIDRHHHQGRRDDDDAGAMRLLHQFVEMLDEIGIDRLGGHEHQRHVLCLAGKEIALGDVLHMLADIGPHAGERGLSRLVAARRPQRGEGLERELGVDSEEPRVARQADDAVGPCAVRERELEIVGACRQAVAHDRLHPSLAEGASRLLVGENVFQRHHLARHFGQPRLGGVDHREPLVELAEILSRPLRLVLDSGPEPFGHARQAAAEFGARLRQRGEARLDRLLPLVGDVPLAPARGGGAHQRDEGEEQQKRQRGEGRGERIGEVDRHAVDDGDGRGGHVWFTKRLEQI